ncbi:type II toxin-antitoxin system HipA family toxin [Solimonas variicoloris]|uniref:type II toxin-antitoxin system HipA family toxin n=1 Tax=Solimonas variicoloris TaxID=254408 RepID=UPI000369FD87|nr:type II toxin-antitoxin system HipA family toxin [Solimonas variicoloris]
MPGRLWVFLSGQRVGTLDERHGRLSFTYEAGAHAPLSVRLPLRAEPYDDASCRSFFDNLLPEGSWRQSICRQLRIDERDDFRLLAAIGAECAGAVSLHADPAWTPVRGVYRPTTEVELRRWVLNPAARPALQSSPGLRLSLAGAQDKLLLHFDGQTPCLCEGGAPSTVILKPDIHDPANAIELSAFNERLSVCLARQCGIDAVDAFWYAGAYAVHRYDRVLRPDGWQRLHQEDFAQIAGVPAVAKYEEHGGPGWQQCFAIVDDWIAAPAASRLQLLQRLFFNLCLGNNDAHAKNFALLHELDGRRPRLAPAYDLLCTQVYGPLSKTMAMAIGGEADPTRLNRAAWAQFAKTSGFTITILQRFAAQMAAQVAKALPDLLARTEAAHPALKSDLYPARRRLAFFRRYAATVAGNGERLAASFAA